LKRPAAVCIGAFSGVKRSETDNGLFIGPRSEAVFVEVRLLKPAFPAAENKRGKGAAKSAFCKKRGFGGA
jgi:hypothetical protein